MRGPLHYVARAGLHAYYRLANLAYKSPEIEAVDLPEEVPDYAGGTWELIFGDDRTAWWIHDETGDAIVLSIDDRLRSHSWEVHYTPEASREPGHVVTSGSTVIATGETKPGALEMAIYNMKHGRTGRAEA